MRILPLLWLGACATPAPFDPEPLDTGSPDVDGADEGPACDGVLTVDFSGAPADEELRASGLRWTADDLRFQVGSTPDGFQIRHDDDDPSCLLLEPGTLLVDSLPTGCAFASVVLQVEDRCFGPCMSFTAGNPEAPVGRGRTSTTMTPSAVGLTPPEPFRFLQAEALDGTLCSLELTLAPLPEALRPEDTGDLF